MAHLTAIHECTYALEHVVDRLQRARILQQRSDAHVYTRAYGAALADIDAALVLDSECATYASHRSIVLRYLGRYADAEGELQRALDLNRRNAR